jgi:putative oxidoreductase
MTEIAALGIIVIMVGAIVLFTGKNGFNMMNSGFEYNYALITMALALIGTGPGAFKFGCCKKE